MQSMKQCWKKKLPTHRNIYLPSRESVWSKYCGKHLCCSMGNWVDTRTRRCIWKLTHGTSLCIRKHTLCQGHMRRRS
eukprot:3599935-Ditylum_brightwellii.AAC.1